MAATVIVSRLICGALLLLLALSASVSITTRIGRVYFCAPWQLALILVAVAAVCGVLLWAWIGRLLLPYVRGLRRNGRWAFVLASVFAGLACALLYRPDQAPLQPSALNRDGGLTPVATFPVTAWGQTVQAFRLDAMLHDPRRVQGTNKGSPPWRAVLPLPAVFREWGGALELLMAPPEPAPTAAEGQLPSGVAGPQLRILLVGEEAAPRCLKEWVLDPLHNPAERCWNEIRLDLPGGARAVVVEALPVGDQPVGRPGAASSFVYVHARPAKVPLLRTRYLTDWVSFSLVVAALLWGAGYTQAPRAPAQTAPTARPALDGGPPRSVAALRRARRAERARAPRTPAQTAPGACPAQASGQNSRVAISSVAPRPARIIKDVGIGVCLATAAALASFTTARRVAPLCLDQQHLVRYFEGDCIPRFESMTDRQSTNRRTNVHPLFPLLTYPTVSAIRWTTGAEPLTAVLLLLGATAAGWLAAIYATLRLSGCRTLDAVVFSLLAATSASAVFWFIVPETYPLGSLTILVPLLLVVIAQQRRVRTGWYLAVSALSLSITTTNWMSGIVASVVRLPVIRAVAVTGLALGIYLALWPLQQSLFRDVRFITEVREERAYVKQVQTAGRQTALLSFIYHSMVMPVVRVAKEPPNIVALTTQGSAPGSRDAWGLSAAGIWSVVLGLGVIGVVRTRAQPRFRIALAVILLGQFALHFNYGGETFLYSCNFVVLLVYLSACGTFTRGRPVVLGLAGALVVCNAVNNFSALADVVAIMRAHPGTVMP